MATTEEILRNARWELRVWDVDETVHDRLYALNADPDITAHVDCYLIGPRYEFNAKIRDGVLDVKRLLERRSGFQRWVPDWSGEQPYEPKELNRLLVELGADRHDDLEPMSNTQLIDFVNSVNELNAVAVTKKRRHFDLGDVIGEISEVEVDEAQPRMCVVIESTDIDRLKELRKHLGLEGVPNIAIHNAIKQMLPRLGRDAD